MKKNLIIDFSNLIYRCIYIAATPPKYNRSSSFDDNFSDQFKTESEIYDYWRHLVINSVINLITKDNYDRVIIAYDSRSYWRKEVYPEYKANRKQARDNSIINFDNFLPILNQFIIEFKDIFSSLYHLEVNNTEADDIAAILTKKFSNDGESVVLVTTDKDFHQLLKYDNVEIYNAQKKEMVNAINPERDLQIKCIMGDRGDNIPAIKPKTGPVRAEKILNSGQLVDYMLLEESNMNEEQINMVKNYKRNVTLIDFDYIPQNIQNKIIDNFDNYKLKPFSQADVLKWCNSHNLKELSSRFLSNASYPLMKLYNKS